MKRTVQVGQLFKLILCVIFTFTAYVLNPAIAIGGLLVAPQLVELDSRNRNTVLTLVNRGDTAETFRISVINYHMDGAGNLSRIEVPSDNDAFAEGLFRYAPRQITLKPGKPQTVRVLYRRPAGLKIGEYRSHLLFQQIPSVSPKSSDTADGSEIAVEIKAIFGISIPVIIRHGNLSGSGRLTALKLVNNNSVEAIALRINRSGNQSLRGDLIATADGQEVGRLNNVAVYLSTPHRDVTLPLFEDKLKRLSGKIIEVTYRPREGKSGVTIASGKLTYP